MEKYIYVLVGLPGCGKSTWADRHLYKNYNKIFSSDEYRAKICGDENDQSKNNLIWSTLYSDLEEVMKTNEGVCLDATNITVKDRSKVLELAEKYEYLPIAVVFDRNLDKIKMQNNSRDRVVPEYVIEKMNNKFVMPSREEGFGAILQLDDNWDIVHGCD